MQQTLRQRLQSGFLIGGALIAGVFWLPTPWVVVALMAVCGLALWEFYGLLSAANIPAFRYVGVFSGLALVATTWFSLRASGGAPSDLEWILLFLVTCAVFLRQFPQKNNPRPLETVASTLFGFMYAGYLFNFFTKLLTAWGDAEGRLLVLYLVLVVKFSDVGAYFVGCSFGRHKLFPRISPAKSWEGLCGAILAGVVVSLLFRTISGGQLGMLTMHVWDALILGVLLVVLGIFGDLTESLFKRAAGVKDSSRMILGMGGVLDVLDSLLFTAPALYTYVRLFMK
ncbi:MAG TPA: phosphatidate cytidylyltransferase [Kiritimatiellia bacterium]|nr:phosphatidate cytidylyltransferase [Kiritimatiellia bacterium]